MEHKPKAPESTASESVEQRVVNLYQKRVKIHPRAVAGVFQRLRRYVAWPLMLAFFLTPWLSWEGRQAVLFDLSARQFHVFGFHFWPQDMSLLGLVLIVCAFGLFFVTALYGRVWCGYACPQTVWTSLFLFIEQRIEGDRNHRIKLDEAPWSVAKLSKKALKHSLWVGVALVSALTFVSYFYGAKALWSDLFHFSVESTSLFWLMVFTFSTYLAAGWLREQVCQYMCPYARFQSVMFEPDTLIVAYDAGRGEPRGARSKRDSQKAATLGACVDCTLCVQVCPAGIDIRQGLQHECIGCALCIDACDEVMEKMDYPKGLIRYATENALQQRPKARWRFKVIGYGVVLLLALVFLGYRLLTLSSTELTVIRDRGQVSSLNQQGWVENHYQLKLVNKRDASVRFSLSLSGLPDAVLTLDPQALMLSPNEVKSVSLRVSASPSQLQKAVTPIELTLSDGAGEHLVRESRFIHLNE